MLSDALSQTIDNEASAALARIGRAYYDKGLLHLATSPYLKIIAVFPDSPEAEMAVKQVISIAKAFEARGQLRMAEAIYDRLEEAAHFSRWDGKLAEYVDEWHHAMPV